MAKWVTSSLSKFAEDTQNYTTFIYNTDEQNHRRIHWSRQLHRYTHIEVRQRFPIGVVLGSGDHRMWINCIHKVSRRTDPNCTTYRFECGPKEDLGDADGKEIFFIQCV